MTPTATIQLACDPTLNLAWETCKAKKSQVGEICYKWLPDECKARGVKFQHLRRLEKLGLLTRAEGNSRAWYKVNA